jgi:hypothetical protein
MKSLRALFLVHLALGSAAGAEDLEIPFEVAGAEPVILVRATANGKPALLILDTGSSRTILRPELADALSSGLPGSGFSDGGPGLRANGRWTRATIRLGGKSWRRMVVAMNFDEVSRAYGMRVDGLLGGDLLREFDRVTIDFRSATILLSGGKEASASR